MTPRIGIDFDNTLVCYDELFARLAHERGLLAPCAPDARASAACAAAASPAELAVRTANAHAPAEHAVFGSGGKRSVRDRLRESGREAEWTALQALAYGPRIDEALPFAGARTFLECCASRGVDVFVVSHKTRFPYAEPRTDLREAAFGWLRRHGFTGRASAPLALDRIYFEPTRARKIARIAALGCTHFVDDLAEFLAEPDLPPSLVRVLFEPLPAGATDSVRGACRVARSWEAVAGIVFDESACESVARRNS